MVNPDVREPDGAVGLEGTTRDRIVALVGSDGPLTTPELAERLELTETAVRRHVDNLLQDGTLAEHVPSGPRRRGRPARSFVLSPSGQRRLGSSYDELAEQAVRFLLETGGAQAVRAFAERRLEDLETRYAGLVASAGTDPADRAEALSRVLDAEGYAASVRPVPGPDGRTSLIGVQVCQGHCPVQDVAEEFPEFCEAETATFSRLLGVHVQRLATLAHGEHVCTTFVPTATPKESR